MSEKQRKPVGDEGTKKIMEPIIEELKKQLITEEIQTKQYVWQKKLIKMDVREIIEESKTFPCEHSEICWERRKIICAFSPSEPMLCEPCERMCGSLLNAFMTRLIRWLR